MYLKACPVQVFGQPVLRVNRYSLLSRAHSSCDGLCIPYLVVHCTHPRQESAGVKTQVSEHFD